MAKENIVKTAARIFTLEGLKTTTAETKEFFGKYSFFNIVLRKDHTVSFIALQPNEDADILTPDDFTPVKVLNSTEIENLEEVLDQIADNEIVIKTANSIISFWTKDRKEVIVKKFERTWKSIHYCDGYDELSFTFDTRISKQRFLEEIDYYVLTNNGQSIERRKHITSTSIFRAFCGNYPTANWAWYEDHVEIIRKDRYTWAVKLVHPYLD